jgi:ADP-L-glycero-D-manno-heptose 6-epimerase
LENDQCGIFNIGYGKATAWKYLSKSLFKALGQPENIQFIDMPGDLVGQYQNHTCAEMSKYLRTHPNFSFQFDIEHGVIDCVRNYLVKDARW